MEYRIMGIDPGIVDTGMVEIMLDPEHECYSWSYKVYTSVSNMADGEMFEVDPSFLRELRERAALTGGDKFVEGYRNRGRSMRQDQQMTKLVETIKRTVTGSVIVDNTGVKKVVKPALMELFDFRFERTHHADLESAARIALVGAIKSDRLNPVVTAFVKDARQGKGWRYDTYA